MKPSKKLTVTNLTHLGFQINAMPDESFFPNVHSTKKLSKTDQNGLKRTPNLALMNSEPQVLEPPAP